MPRRRRTGRRRARRAGAGSRRSAGRCTLDEAASASCAGNRLAARRSSARARQPVADAGRRSARCARRPAAAKRAALRERGAAVGCSASSDAGVLRRIDDHRDARVVLRRRAQHRRAADVDVLDRVLVAAVRVAPTVAANGYRFTTSRSIGAMPCCGHHRVVGAGAAEQAAVDLRMQGLDPAVHDFREAGDVGDVAHRQAGVAQRARGAAGGKQLDAMRGERARQFDQAGLVGNGQQRPADGQAVGGHRKPRKRGGEL